jgi:crotonobetainyl-CoA:carnitine CoA-transferase CaiB-like acyl-CoA transferase
VYGFNLDRITDWQGMRDEGDSDRPPERGAKYQFYRTSDGKYALFAAQEQKFWANFCRAVDREDLLSSVDETMPVDFGRLEGLQEALTEIMAQRTLAEWLQLAIDADVPIGPAHDVADVVTDPQIRSREIVAEGEHPVAGPFTYVGSPVVVQGQPYSVRHHAPALGEQTDEILGELGYGPERIAELRANGIV